mmetsp:Transcript_15074/g.26735  ORF Transcript_15074/g.26735 Transcript_15074/m.26735 type:complete len:205 (-) Transcript_15074:393-1007(-)
MRLDEHHYTHRLQTQLHLSGSGTGEGGGGRGGGRGEGGGEGMRSGSTGARRATEFAGTGVGSGSKTVEGRGVYGCAILAFASPSEFVAERVGRGVGLGVITITLTITLTITTKTITTNAITTNVAIPHALLLLLLLEKHEFLLTLLLLKHLLLLDLLRSWHVRRYDIGGVARDEQYGAFQPSYERQRHRSHKLVERLAGQLLRP